MTVVTSGYSRPDLQLMDDVDAFVSGVFEVDLDPDGKLAPTAAR